MTAATWDDRFSARHYVYGTEPNAFLVRERWRLETGMSVLAVADGEGRNGVWLAQQGMQVSTVDGSAVGVRKALRLALDRGVILRTAVADLTDWHWPVATFDVAVAVFAHFPSAVRPGIHRAMLDSVKPGGLVLLEAFRPEQIPHRSGGPKDPDLLYRIADLQADFAAAEILMLEEATPELDEGPLHQGPAATVRLVARRL